MSTLSLPSTPSPAGISFALLTNSQFHISPLSNITQTQELPGSHWAVNVQLPPMRRETALAWRSWLVQLRGPAGRFYLGDFSACRDRCGAWYNIVQGADCASALLPSLTLEPSLTLMPSGTGCIPEATLTPPASITLTAAALRGATSVQIDSLDGWDYATFGVNPNWDEGDEALLCAGEMIQVGEQLVTLTDAIRPGSCSGGQLIFFEPPLHKAYPVGTAVVVSDAAVGIFRLVDDTQARWDVGEAVLHGIRFSAIEVIGT